MQKDVVPAEKVADNQLVHRRAPVVAGKELASAVIQDSIKYLGIKPTGISQLNGPYLQVFPAGENASDILLVGSWRTHFQPGGDGTGRVLDNLPPALPKPSTPAAQLLAASTTPDEEVAQLRSFTPGQAPVTQGAYCITTPGVAALDMVAVAGAGDDGRRQDQVDSGQLQNHNYAAGPMQHDHADGVAQQYQHHHHHQRMQQQQGPYPSADSLQSPLALPQTEPPRSQGPIIEECPSDTELSSPRKHIHPHLHNGGREPIDLAGQSSLEPVQQQYPGRGSQQGALAHKAPHAMAIVQLVDSSSEADRSMEDVTPPPPPQQQQSQHYQMAGTMYQGPSGAADVAHRPSAVAGGFGDRMGLAANGQMVQLEGLGLTAASALATAAATQEAACAGIPLSAVVPASGGPLMFSPRPRSEWELDPSKITMGRRLAVGGFGEVFMAKYEGTLVAVKRLLATDSDTTQRFLDEVHMLARLRHPNLLLFMGYTLTPEPSIVTEFMARGSLFHILRQAGNRPPDARTQRAVAIAVARGMAYLHSRTPPILHLDLKSPNVLVDDRWRVKIADFGLSRVRQHTYVSSGAAAGSPEWMAPEVLRCDHYAEAADVYSYGVVLWELLTGQAPWADLNAMQVVGAVGFARRSLPDPSEGDELLLHLCKACRAHNPTQRPTFAQIVESMDSHFGGLAASAAAAAAAAANQTALGNDGTGVEQASASEPGAAALPALPAPGAQPDVRLQSPPVTTASSAGDAIPRVDGVARAPAPVPSASMAVTGTNSMRITRRHSLAASPDAGPQAAGGGGIPPLSAGGAPLRLDARFTSVHESPRSRRRYRSPRGEDMVGPPAITARLQDGRKTPSPRTASGQLWRAGVSTLLSDSDTQQAQQPTLQQQQPPEPAPARRLPVNASPFAMMAGCSFGSTRVNNANTRPGTRSSGGAGDATLPVLADASVGHTIDEGMREAAQPTSSPTAQNGDVPAEAEPEAMELGSPTAQSAAVHGFNFQQECQPAELQRNAEQEQQRQQPMLGLDVHLPLPPLFADMGSVPSATAGAGAATLLPLAAAAPADAVAPASVNESSVLDGGPPGQPQHYLHKEHEQELSHMHPDQLQQLQSQSQMSPQTSPQASEALGQMGLAPGQWPPRGQVLLAQSAAQLTAEVQQDRQEQQQHEIIALQKQLSEEQLGEEQHQAQQQHQIGQQTGNAGQEQQLQQLGQNASGRELEQQQEEHYNQHLQQKEQLSDSSILEQQSPKGLVPGRPGHRRVSSDVASRLLKNIAPYPQHEPNHQPTPVALQQPHLQQTQSRAKDQPIRRLLAALASSTHPGSGGVGSVAGTGAAGNGSGAGMLVPMGRRSRGLGRNSAPMRYTYGGSSSGAGGQASLPHGHMHPYTGLQSSTPAVPRPRSYQTPPVSHPLVFQGSDSELVYMPGSPPAGTHVGSGDGTSATAALSAPLSLSPLGLNAVVGAAVGAATGVTQDPNALGGMLGSGGSGISGGGHGSDPWPDNNSELSFAFILRDNVSVCSDDYVRSTSMDRLPHLEESEMADIPPTDSEPVEAAEVVTASDASADGSVLDAGGALTASDIGEILAFELPRPFLHPESPAHTGNTAGAATPPSCASPFAKEAFKMSWGAPATGNGSDGGAADVAVQADLWAALQQHGSAGHPGTRRSSAAGAGGSGSPPSSGGGGDSGGGTIADCRDPHPGHDQHQQQPIRLAAATAWLLQTPTDAVADMMAGVAGRPGAPGLDTLTDPLAGSRVPSGHQDNHHDVDIQGGSTGPGGDQLHLHHAATVPEPAAPIAIGRSLNRVPSASAMTYRSGRFKITIEPSPPVDGPEATGMGAPRAGQQLSAPDGAGAVERGMFAATPGSLSGSLPSSPVANADAAAPSATPSEPSDPSAAGGLYCSLSMAMHGNGPLSPCTLPAASGCAEAPAAMGRFRSSHSGHVGPAHGHAGIGHHGPGHGPCPGDPSGGPPVALNSVTMYRKGRFFVSSHAAAGTHSVSVTNPLAASNPTATGTTCMNGGGGGGSSSCAATGIGATAGCCAGRGLNLPSSSMHEELDYQDMPSAPPSPFAVVAHAASAAAAPWPACTPLSSPCSREDGVTVGSLPDNRTGWAARGAAALQVGQAPATQKFGSLGRQYSCGRFTVAECIVTAPPDQRRASSGGMTTEPVPVNPLSVSFAGTLGTEPTVAAWVTQQSMPPAASVDLAAQQSLRRTGSLLKPALQAQTAAAAAAGVGVSPTTGLFRLPSSRRPSLQGSLMGSGEASLPVSAPTMTAMDVCSGGSSRGGSGGSGGSGVGSGSGGGSPRTEQVVVRKVGRFTVREVEPAGGGGSNGSSGSNDRPSSCEDLAGDAAAAGAPGPPASPCVVVATAAAAMACAHAGSRTARCSPSDEAVLLGSRQSSSSFMSAGGCSRVSSASQGLADHDGAVGAGHEQETQIHSRPGKQLRAADVEALAAASRILAESGVGGAGPSAPRILHVKSKGRFTVIEHEAPHPPLSAAAPLLAPQLTVQVGDADKRTMRATSDLALEHVQGAADHTAPRQPPLADSASLLAGAVSTAPSAELPARGDAQLLHHAATDAAPSAPSASFGGVLRPPPPAADLSDGTVAAPAALAPGDKPPLQGPHPPDMQQQQEQEVQQQDPQRLAWGQSGPQDALHRARFYEDTAKLMRERMEWYALGREQGQGLAGQQRLPEQERGWQEGQADVGDVWRQLNARMRRRGGSSDGGVEEEGGGAGGGERVAYEVSIGNRFKIQISHQLQGAGNDGELAEEEGEDEEDGDALMVDVGIVQSGEGSGSEGGEDGGADGDGLLDGEEEEGADPLEMQPPETPVHEPVHERDRGGARPADEDDDDADWRRRRRKVYGSEEEAEDRSETDEDSMEF